MFEVSLLFFTKHLFQRFTFSRSSNCSCWYETPYFLQIALQDSEDTTIYVTGGQTKIPVYISGIIKIEKSEISVFDSDLGSVDVQKKYAASTSGILFLLLPLLITFSQLARFIMLLILQESMSS